VVLDTCKKYLGVGSLYLFSWMFHINIFIYYLHKIFSGSDNDLWKKEIYWKYVLYLYSYFIWHELIKKCKKDTFQSANRKVLLFNTCLLSSFAEDWKMYRLRNIGRFLSLGLKLLCQGQKTRRLCTYVWKELHMLLQPHVETCGLVHSCLQSIDFGLFCYQHLLFWVIFIQIYCTCSMLSRGSLET